MGAWPAVAYEELPWRSSIDPSLVSRRVRERHSAPYSAALVPAIAAVELALPASTLALTEEASAEIARFDAEVGAELAPFAAILLRSESAASSMIENLTSGAKAIALAELGGVAKRNAAEIVANVRAMQAAVALADRLDEHTVLAMHEALMGHLHPEVAGRWREEQVWIGGDGYGPHGADFVPPHHTHVPAAIADLLNYARRDDVPVMAQAAVAHAQLETIHPFPDGNGRTGRALVHAMLRNKELTRRVTIPVSAGLLTDTGRYFSALTAYRAGEVVPIVELMASASLHAIANGRQLAAEITRIRTGWDDTVVARRDAAAWRLADLVLRQPVVNSETVARELAIPPTSALAAIGVLVSSGVLVEITGGKRNRLWQSPEILGALDDFAARAGRRRLDDS